MSDNKIYNTLEFDDDIDFDGLDEFENELSEDTPAVAVVTEEAPAEETADVIDEARCEEAENDECEAEVNETPFNIEVSDRTDEQTNEVESPSEGAFKSDKLIKRLCAVNTAVSVITLCALITGLYFSYKHINTIKADLEAKNAEVKELEGKNSALEAEYLEAMNMYENETEETVPISEIETEQGKIIQYDSSVGYSWVPILAGIEQNTYIKENFTIDDRYRMTYTENGEESSYFGIDVSSYQGEIDWQLVKEDGVEFAFLRIGYRGYGEEGKLCADEFFAQNYEAAHDAGIDLGIYFFSQAANVNEAVEEAEFVLSLLENRTLEYPIVFDWENVYTGDPEDVPRTEDVMPQTLTLSAIAFCETVKDAGYEAMIYTNKKLATIKYDLRQLSEYPVWLAYYDTDLNYCYDFDIWQYGTGQVDGIEGEVDVNIAIIK